MCLEPVKKMTGILWRSLSKKGDKDAKNWILSDVHEVSDILFHSKYRSAIRNFSPSEKQSNWHWEWLVAALETLFIDTLTHTHTLKHAHGYKWQKTFIVGFKQHFVFAQHRPAVKYDNTGPSDTARTCRITVWNIVSGRWHLILLALKKKKMIKSRLGTHVQFLQSLFGEILITFSSHKMPCEGATGDGGLLNVTAFGSFLLPSTSLFVAPVSFVQASNSTRATWRKTA